MLLSGLLLFVLVARLFQIQVISSGGYLRLSRDNQFRQIRVAAPRGLILDRNGSVLAKNVAACEASVSARSLEQRPETLPRLAAMLGRDADALQAVVDRGLEDARPRIVLDRDLDKPSILVLEEQLPTLPGLVLRDWARRRYPRGDLMAHVLGYVGEVREEELEPGSADPRAYRPGDLVGRAGVEKTYEPFLRGAEGKTMILVNARGAELETVQSLAPEPGSNVVLTLDLALSAELDSALAFWGAGAGVVMDVHTGEILAAASRPSFDPNLLVGGIPAPLWQRLSEDPGKPLFNRISQATYAPGSTFKPIVALEGLERGVVNRDSRFRPCTGGLRLGRRTFHCWDRGGHGSVGAVGAISQSCDVYFYQLGEELGVDRMAEESRRFGLGEATGVDLDGEARGLVPDRDWYNRRFGEGKWTTGNVWNVAIGQGEVLVTVLQMARLYAALGNGGFLPVPRLRHHVEDAAGNTVIPFSPSRGERIRLDTRALRVVREGLVDVFADEDGTANGSAIDDFPMAGKTGTVQNPHGAEHAWFCGYAPADDPQIAIALLVEHGEHGSDIAPIFRQLVATWFHLDVTPLRRGRRSAGQGGRE
ncbi:MAG: penicillin-binding protein 2 [Candidatus Krumholzibacteriia bacterium]|nr:penicillin-binding protein 2 [bacterium]MCB9514761.1 penicillin-binding protein 2 [Candidatus Latescibacterota bacterium]